VGHLLVTCGVLFKWNEALMKVSAGIATFSQGSVINPWTRHPDGMWVAA